MDKLIRYFAWNAMLVGSLILATIFNINTIVKVLTVFFAFESCMYAVVVIFAQSKIMEDGIFKMYSRGAFAAYKLALEPVYIFTAFALGHKAISVCMFITMCAYIYTWATAINLKKERDGEQHNSSRS